MKATVRLADGSLVEGELVSTGYAFAPSVANACAGAFVPWTYGTVVVQSTIEPTPTLPPSTAACAGAPTSYWITTG